MCVWQQQFGLPIKPDKKVTKLSLHIY